MAQIRSITTNGTLGEAARVIQVGSTDSAVLEMIVEEIGTDSAGNFRVSYRGGGRRTVLRGAVAQTDPREFAPGYQPPTPAEDAAGDPGTDLDPDIGTDTGSTPATTG